MDIKCLLAYLLILGACVRLSVCLSFALINDKLRRIMKYVLLDKEKKHMIGNFDLQGRI